MLRGYFRPEFAIGDTGGASLAIGSNTVEFLVGNVKNSTWQYWTHNWYPTVYRGIGCSLGTYLTTSKEILNFLEKNTPGTLYLLGKLTIIDKRDYISKAIPIEVFALKQMN